MTDRERRLYDSLKGSGWFEGELAPEILVFYDITDRKQRSSETDGTSEKSAHEADERDKKSRRKGKKSCSCVADCENRRVFSMCRGAALIYRDSISVWENGRLVERIPIPENEYPESVIYDGTAAVRLSDRILFRGRMKYKTAYYAAVKRYQQMRDGTGSGSLFEEKGSVCIKCGRPLDTLSGEVCRRCKSKKQVVARLLRFIVGCRLYLLLSVILFFVITGVNLIAPVLNKTLVDDYIIPKNEKLAAFVVVILSILFVNLLSRFLSIVRSRVLITASNRVIVNLRDTVFEKVEKLSVSNVMRRTAGNLMNRITNDTQVIQNFLTNQLSPLAEQLIMFICIAAILFWYDWKLALMILLPTPVAFFLNWKFRSRVRKRYDVQWWKFSNTQTFLHDIFSGIRVVKAYGTEEREGRRFDRYAASERDIQISNERFFAIFSPATTFIIGLGEIFLLYYVARRNLDGQMSLGYMSMFTSYVSLIYGPLQSFGNLLRQFSNMLNSASKVFEILDEKVDVSDSDSPVERKIDGKIELKGVAFDYDERNEVLKDINLTINPGEMIGIVGRSGVGKSTLINLVMRMYDVNQGEILIDGVNIKEYSQECLRSQIGAVLQETFLFSGTIYENIAYAKPDAPKEDVIAAAKLAGAHDFIIKLPDAYNTKVGERGYTLSGGERQRVTIARALLHDPRILILDEATSALDTETEKQIQDALGILIKNRTTLAIAHRLSTLRNATRLIVISDGRIKEQGTHEELMAKKGMYYDLVMAQRQMFTIKDKKDKAAV